MTDPNTMSTPTIDRERTNSLLHEALAAGDYRGAVSCCTALGLSIGETVDATGLDRDDVRAWRTSRPLARAVVVRMLRNGGVE